MYVREVKGQKLTLQVSGKLWMRSLVMRDLETGSEWAHLLGQAMAGPMKGTRLKPLVTDMVTWGSWKQQHPTTTVLKMDRTHRRYNRDFYRQADRFVFGFHVQDQHFALPLPVMQERPVLNLTANGRPLVATYDASGTAIHLFDATVNDRVLDFEPTGPQQMRDRETSSTWNSLNGTCVAGPLQNAQLVQQVGIMSFRKAWQNFHPDSKEIRSQR